MKRFRKILVLVSGPDSLVALNRAITLAEENGGNVTALDVLRPPSLLFQTLSGHDSATSLQHDVVQHRKAELTALVEKCARSHVSVDVKVSVGTPYIEMIREVLRDGHDLVMKTAEGRSSLNQRIFGGTAISLMRQCPCPVWVVKSEHNRPYDRILAAVDMEAYNDADAHAGLNHRILQVATSLAKIEGAELHVVHVWQLWCDSIIKSRSPPEDYKDMLSQQETASREAFAKLLAQYELPFDSSLIHLIKGDAGSVIPQLVDAVRVELLVMGTVCRTGIPGFITGNTAEQVLSDADCSVLTLKPDGFQTPVTLPDER